VNSRRLTVLFVLAGLFARPARAQDTLPPSIIHEACVEYLKGKPFDIIARFEDKSQLFDPKVMFRSGGDSHWKQAAFVKGAGSEDFKATIKLKDLKGTVEYFIEVFDEFGNGPARMGSPEAPIKVAASKAPEPCEQVPTSKTVAVTAGSATTPPPPFPPAPPPAPRSAPVDNGTKTPPPTGAGAGAKPGAGPSPRTSGFNIMTQPIPRQPEGPCDRVDRPLYCEAWLWATLGTLVLAGVGVGVVLALRSDETPPVARESVRLIVSGPDPTAVAPDP
jgi:hypothetical protein